MVDLGFWKGGFQYVLECAGSVPARGVWGHAPPGKFLISDLLRSFLVPTWGEIARVGWPTAKCSHCVWSLTEVKDVALLRSGQLEVSAPSNEQTAADYFCKQLHTERSWSLCDHLSNHFCWNEYLIAWNSCHITNHGYSKLSGLSVILEPRMHR